MPLVGDDEGAVDGESLGYALLDGESLGYTLLDGYGSMARREVRVSVRHFLVSVYVTVW